MDIIGLIPSFGGLLYTLVAFIAALSVIVAVHEYGHYIVGRWCGIHAEVFSLGFGPVLFSRTDRRGTRWQIAALPFGGYVKFLGDADAASGKDAEALQGMDPDRARHTMHGAPLWARAATVAAGPIFNFILSILVFAAIIAWRGEPTEPLTIAELKPAPYETGLRPGDALLAIEGQPTPPLESFSEFVETLPVKPSYTYTVRREAGELDVPGPHPYPPIVGSVTPGSAALDAGIRPGDVILEVDGAPIHAFSQLREITANSEGRVLRTRIWRDGETFELALAPRRMDLPGPDGSFETRYLIGISGGLFFEPQTATPGPLRALSYGVDQTVFIVRASLSGLYHVAAGAISTCNLRGPVGIAETSGAAASQGLASFIWFIAVLSTAVGLLNLFPIPILDGGHLVFHAYEAVTGRPPSDRALRILMTVGLTFIVLLMGFALTNDFLCP